MLQAEGARARDYMAIHRAELLKTVGKVVEREQVRCCCSAMRLMA